MPDPEIPTGREPEPGPLSHTIVRASGLAATGYMLAQLLTMGFYLALARLATPQDFGAATAGSVLVGLGLLFTESGMMAALIHRRDRLEEAAATAVIATIGAGLLFSLLALAAAPLIGLIFQSSRIGEIAAVSSGILFIRSFRVVPEALLQRRLSALRRVVVQPAGVVGSGVPAVIACAHGLGPWGLVIGLYGGSVTEAAVSWAVLRSRPELRRASFEMWRELVSYGRFVIGAKAMVEVTDQLPVFLLGRFVGANALGQFRYDLRMTSTPSALVYTGAT
jgi:PST family polysaccharide transporter